MLPPEGVNVSEVQPHSVRVSWQAVEGADTYTVTFTQTMGDQQLGLCTDSYSGSLATSNLITDIGGEDDDMLQAFTTYSITVTAVSDVSGNSMDSQPTTVTTTQTSRRKYSLTYNYALLKVCELSLTDSTAALLNFRAIAQSSSSISVQWDRLTPCRDVNGLIVEVRVQYRALPSGPVQSVTESRVWNMPVEVSLTGLTPFTNYSIQVAPVNIFSQVGSYSGPVVTQTEEDGKATTVTMSNT